MRAASLLRTCVSDLKNIFGAASVPAPDTSVRFGTASVQVPDTSVRFDTSSIPVPETSVSSVRVLKYIPGTGIPFTKIPGYRHLFGTASMRYRSRRHELDIGIRHVGNFGTNSIPVPDTSLSSVKIGYRHFGKFGTTSTGNLHIDECGTPTHVYPGYRYTLNHNTGGAGICSVPGSRPCRTLRYGLVQTRYWYPTLS